MNTVIGYSVSSLLFILGIKLLGKAKTARLGNSLSAIGMLLAIITTLLEHPMSHGAWIWGAAILGTLVGLIMAIKVPMTAMPEMVALLNGFGGFASLFVGWAEGIKSFHGAFAIPPFEYRFWQISICLTLLIGGLTFTGSLLAYGKLSQRISGVPIVFRGQRIVSFVLLLGALFSAYAWMHNLSSLALYTLISLGLVLGVLFVLPIGGGDMPVVISLLNSLSGMAAGAAGLIVLNKVLIVAGCLVGTSGIILTIIMCKAMNRSLKNVLFGTFGLARSSSGQATLEQPKTLSTEDAYYLLESARSVAFIPGYGLAVAQAQHAIKELAQRLAANGCEVFYAIHPVAGRMPGHMNVLLAEADVAYDQLIELEPANQRMDHVDVAIVVGANDVVNPAALEDNTSPIYGMPIVEAHKAKTVFVLKRGQGKGFSGLENALFVKENTRMIYGDAKSTLGQLVAEFKNAE